jgi:long-chain acyl-CoA synthetase
VIIGAGRPYLTAIICIRYPVVGKWAEKRRIAFTTYTDLSARPEVYALIRREVELVNASLPEGQRIRKFVLLYKELDADDGELTRTRKVRRSFISDRYGSLVDALYAGETHRYVETEVRFEDGRTGRIAADLKIVDAKTLPMARRAA